MYEHDIRSSFEFLFRVLIGDQWWRLWVYLCERTYQLVQWRNRRGGGRGQSAPRDFWPGNFCWRIGKKEARKKGKGLKLRRKEGKKKENCKREGFFFFLSFFFLFFFFFFFAFHFWKRRKVVLGLPKWEFFYQEKNFHAGKKIRKNDFVPSEKYVCYAPNLVIKAWNTKLNNPQDRLKVKVQPLAN